MTTCINHTIPATYLEIRKASDEKGFTMSSDILICSLLRTLARSKPGGKFLELGTGTGLSTSWILDGMDSNATLISIDNDETHLAIAKKYLGCDERVELVQTDGAKWIQSGRGMKYDFVFADTWPGKYDLSREVLEMLNTGGIYIVDDMLPQPNWPEGHQEKATGIIRYLESRKDMVITKQQWSTGIIIAVKK